MASRSSEIWLFLGEFRRNFRTTGAVLPSGRRLSKALAHFVQNAENGAPRRILEVGPGTGAVTRQIIAALKPKDRLDLVELNESFVDCLRDRFQSDPEFQPAAARSQVLHCSIEELPADTTYDVIVSGLPLNNFAADDVRNILDMLVRLLRPGGTLSFFEYIAVRRFKGLISGPTERQRLQAIGQLMNGLLTGHEVRRDWIWPNVPPAWVHHVRY